MSNCSWGIVWPCGLKAKLVFVDLLIKSAIAYGLLFAKIFLFHSEVDRMCTRSANNFPSRWLIYWHLHAWLFARGHLSCKREKSSSMYLREVFCRINKTYLLWFVKGVFISFLQLDTPLVLKAVIQKRLFRQLWSTREWKPLVVACVSLLY